MECVIYRRKEMQRLLIVRYDESGMHTNRAHRTHKLPLQSIPYGVRDQQKRRSGKTPSSAATTVTRRRAVDNRLSVLTIVFTVAFVFFLTLFVFVHFFSLTPSLFSSPNYCSLCKDCIRKSVDNNFVNYVV